MWYDTYIIVFNIDWGSVINKYFAAFWGAALYVGQFHFFLFE